MATALTEIRRAGAQPEALHLDRDDGGVPNNRLMPLLLYRDVLDLAGTHDPEPAIIALFATNGWGDAWINGIYPFQHYHACAHEVLAIARGSAEVQLGGAAGPIVTLAAGTVVVIPAGVGHCRRSQARGLSVVGAYPPGSVVDLKRDTAMDHAAALREIPRVPRPGSDPVFGRGGPLLTKWSAQVR